jgi:predicted HicB family RNase H-like nuclease
MKRIIDGKTYDTDTATEVFRPGGNPLNGAWWGMYQTRHGAFFEVNCNPRGYHTFSPLSDEEAQKLLEKRANHLVEKFFGPMPEYGSAEKRLTLRIPIGLARRVEAAANGVELDVNKYIQRCLEKAVSSDGHKPTVT